MKFSTILAATFAAAVSCSDCSTNCCFKLTASGGRTNGTVGQLSDGQTRIGGGLPSSEFCISNTKIEDSRGRGCIITSPQTQWQCDSEADPFAGFTIDCYGLLNYNGSSAFWECQTGDHGEANIYTTPGGTVCDPIRLRANKCLPTCGG